MPSNNRKAQAAKPAAKATIKQVQKAVSKVFANKAQKRNFVRRSGQRKLRGVSKFKPSIALPVQGTKMAQSIAAAICLPGSCPNLRVKPSPTQASPTGVVSLHSIEDINQPAVKGTYDHMVAGVGFVALFRDPFRHSILFTPNPNRSIYTYQAWWNRDSNSTNTTVTVESPDFIPMDPTYYVGTTSYLPHGSTLFVGLDQTHSWVYADTNATLRVVQNTHDATAVRNIWQWQSGEESLVATAPFTASATLDLTVNASGYYRFTYLPGSVSPNTISIILTGNEDVFAHRSVPHVEDHFGQLSISKVNATSVMITPIAPILNQGGDIAGGYVSGHTSWLDYTNFAAINELNMVNRDTKPYQVGMYAFLKPSSLSDFDFASVSCQMEGGQPELVGYDLRSASSYLVMMPICSSVNGQAAGQNFLLTINTDVEFMSNDQWFETHRAPGTFMDAQCALEIVSSVAIFHENPLHWTDIRGSIGKGMNFMRRHGKKIASGFSTLFPHLSAPIGAAGDFFASLPEF